MANRLLADRHHACRGRQGPALQAGEQAMVKYVKDLPASTELRVGNATIGEVGADALTWKAE